MSALNMGRDDFALISSQRSAAAKGEGGREVSRYRAARTDS